MSDSSPTAYIYMVQLMIETCLTFNMSKEECMEALLWKELVKENKDFFETYEQNIVKPMSEDETDQMIQNIICGSSDD